jgi:hypothetical protein
MYVDVKPKTPKGKQYQWNLANLVEEAKRSFISDGIDLRGNCIMHYDKSKLLIQGEYAV